MSLKAITTVYRCCESDNYIDVWMYLLDLFLRLTHTTLLPVCPSLTGCLELQMENEEVSAVRTQRKPPCVRFALIFAHVQCSKLPPTMSSPNSLLPPPLSAAFLHTLSSGTFLSQSKVQVYLNDALNILLKVSSHQATSPQTPSAFSASQRPLRFLSNYFEGVLDEVSYVRTPSKRQYSPTHELTLSAPLPHRTLLLANPLPSIPPHTQTVNHTVGKNFAYICCTRYNRGTFLKGFVSCTSGISEKQVS